MSYLSSLFSVENGEIAARFSPHTIISLLFRWENFGPVFCAAIFATSEEKETKFNPSNVCVASIVS